MSDTGSFDDFEDDGPDDAAAVDDYMAEVAEAAAAFDVPIREPGTPEP
jgi:hypothetical protein